MDHPSLYAWGLAPTPVGAYRGPLSTSGIDDVRGGAFRAEHAAFRFDIGNDGWSSPTGAPDTTVAEAVKTDGLFGARLREHLATTLPARSASRCTSSSCPRRTTASSIDPRHVDPLGNPRPVIDYSIDDYTLAGMAAATRVYQEVFRHAGIEDCTDPADGSWFRGGLRRRTSSTTTAMGHFAGTHVMGERARTSVVDADQRSWEHRNLFLVGSGSFPTMGTSNPTLTMAALALRTAERIDRRS